MGCWSQFAGPGVQTRAYMDDRMPTMASSELQAFENAWSASVAWETEYGWQANPMKTQHMRADTEQAQLWCGDKACPRPDALPFWVTTWSAKRNA